jgi:hypothetical protein
MDNFTNLITKWSATGKGLKDFQAMHETDNVIAVDSIAMLDTGPRIRHLLVFGKVVERAYGKCFLMLLSLLFVHSFAAAQFEHRIYYGWITDLASEGRPSDAWPSTRIDAKLLSDYDENLRFMHEIGLNELGVWGLFVSREWPLDVEKSIDETRKKQVLSIIEKAHQYNIKVLSGVGVYSWGFDEIIRANPKLACPENRSAMCADQPESWEWQKKVLDYIFSFPIDGVNLQSADLGRCSCGQHKDMNDVEYHALLNQKVIQYIRKTYPGKIIGISSWGMDISKPQDLVHLAVMTKDADYFTDVRGGHASDRPLAFRARMIETIKPCKLATIGTPNIEPPQHWERDRWFLPTAKRAAEDLKILYQEGGRAVENFMHIKVNPGDEATIRLQAAIELNPSADWAEMYKNILSEMFSAHSLEVTNRIFALFVAAEDAYFNNLKDYDPYSADISLEPLVSDKTGDPVYILNQMTKAGMKNYLTEIDRLLTMCESLKKNVDNKRLMEKVTTCLKNTKNDILFCLKH